MVTRAKILAVDDAEDNLFVLEELLGGEFHVCTVKSGERCLDVAQEFQPDLILLDVMMPGIDGYETCRRLRTDPALRHTKIIMVSAKVMPDERLAGYEAGADDYIPKPFDGEELIAKVRVYLRLKSVEEVDRLKSELLALLSHETRTPLTAILAPAEMLGANEPMDLEERQMLGWMIHKAGMRLLTLVERILRLSAMKAGQWEFELQPVSIGQIVRSALNRSAARARERAIEIVEDVAHDCKLPLDFEQVTEVVAALLDNAVRFSPPRSRVTVRVRRDGETLLLRVSDRGEGIDPAFLPRIFDEFASRDIAHHTEGVGLSLAIARQVIRAHAGSIRVESTQSTGTHVTLSFPCDGGAPAHPQRSTPSQPPASL